MLGQGAKIHASASPRPVFADAETAPLRGNRPSRHIRPFPRKAMRPRLAPPRRGGLRTPATSASGQPQRCLLPATGSSSTHVVEMECLGVRTALQRGRAERAPPRKPPSALSPGFSPKASHPGLRPARRTGSAPILPPRLDTRSPSAIIATAVHSHSSARPRGLCLDGGPKKIFPSPCKPSLHFLCSPFAFLVACCRFFPACVYLLASPLRGG